MLWPITWSARCRGGRAAHDVARQVGVREVAVDVGGAAVGLEVDADHPVVLRQRRQEGGVGELDGHHAAVQEHQR
jgi:hypothetical protein